MYIQVNNGMNNQNWIHEYSKLTQPACVSRIVHIYHWVWCRFMFLGIRNQPSTPLSFPPSTPSSTPPSFPPSTPPNTNPSFPPCFPPSTPPSTPPSFSPSFPPSIPPSFPPSTPPSTPLLNGARWFAQVFCSHDQFIFLGPVLLLFLLYHINDVKEKNGEKFKVFLMHCHCHAW